MTRDEYITYMMLWLCVADIDIDDVKRVPTKLIDELVKSYNPFMTLLNDNEQMDYLLYLAEVESLKYNSKLGGLL